MPTFELTARSVPRVETEFRRIVTPFPVPESIPLLERLHAAEPVAMQGQPPVVWDRAEGFLVSDRWGNRWIDWSSGVLITNAGHCDPRVAEAIHAQVDRGLLTSYCFPNEPRLALVERIVELLPDGLDKVFLLTTGSEAVECAIKLCRTRGRRESEDKAVIVTFENAFHGRTLGSQQAGGIPALKQWIGHLDPGFVQIPFPDGFRCPDVSFDLFEQTLERAGVAPEQVAGVMLETYQGGDASFAPVDYMRRLRAWCDEHGAALVCDEVQAGFGRTGRMWGFEHYGITPDLTVFGKGISSSLPLSAVAGGAELMDLHPPGSMTSTHSGNPVCCAAALAGINAIVDDGMVENARALGQRLHARLRELGAAHGEIAGVFGKGLVAGVVLARPDGSPDAATAFDVVRRSVESGLLLFAPVGFGGGTIKICPPLMISSQALEESLGVFTQALTASIAARAAA